MKLRVVAQSTSKVGPGAAADEVGLGFVVDDVALTATGDGIDWFGTELDTNGNTISQEEMDRRAEEAELERLRNIPRNAWGMPLSNRSSLLCAIM